MTVSTSATMKASISLSLIEIAKDTDSGGEWRECMLRVTARLCAKGLSKHEMIEMLILARVTRHDMGYNDEETRAELGVMIDVAGRKWGRPDDEAESASAELGAGSNGRSTDF